MALHGAANDGVVIAIPAWVFDERDQDARDLFKLYASFLRLAISACRVTVVIHRRTEYACTRRLLAFVGRGRARVVLVPDGLDFSMWLRDPFVLRAEKQSRPHAVSASRFKRASDLEFSAHLLKDSGIKHTLTELPLSGGNVISTSTHHFIGMDHALLALATARTNHPSSKADVSSIKRKYQQLLGADQDVVFVGTQLAVSREQAVSEERTETGRRHVICQGNSDWTAQPIFHLDMFLTAVEGPGDQLPTLLVADPRLAQQICPLPAPPNTSAISQNVFDDIATQLSDQGFRVLRCPIPLLGKLQEATNTTKWHFASYNNCVLLGGEANRLAILPSFAAQELPQLRRLDLFVAKLFQQLGMKTRLVKNAHVLAQPLGGLRCLTNSFI